MEKKKISNPSAAVGMAGTKTETKVASPAAQTVQPPTRPRVETRPVVAPGSVPTPEFVKRMSDLTRRAFPAAPVVSSTAPAPKNLHVDLLALELWASGNLADADFFSRWESHLSSCEQCTSRLNAATARRRAG